MAGKAGDVVINLTIRAASFSSALDKAKSQLKGMEGAAGGAGGKLLQFQRSMESAGHSSVSNMQATSASLRLAEGGMNNLLRSAERFAASLPGVASAAQAIFPAVGAIAIANIFYEGEQRVQKFIEKLNEMPRAIEAGFEGMHQHARLATDELRVTNDKLDIAIAKLEGKPENGLALAIDEDRVKVDQLVASVEKAQQEVAKLLKENNPGFFGALLGKAPTGALGGTTNAFRGQLTEIAQDLQEAEYKGDTAGIARLKKEYSDKLAAQQSASDAAVAANPTTRPPTFGDAVRTVLSFHTEEDNRANREAALGFQKSAHDAVDQQQQEVLNLAKEARQRDLQAGKDKAEAAKRAAEELHQAQERAAQQQMQLFERGYVEMEKAGNADVFQTRAYWEKKLQAMQKGSEEFNRLAGALNYDRVNDKLGSATKQMDELLQRSLHPHKDASESTFLREQEHAADEQARRVTEIRQRAADEQAKLQERAQLSDVSIALSHGEISRYQALVAEAQIHAAAFGAEIADVERRLAEAQALHDLPGMDEEIAKRQAQLAQLRAQAQQQAQQDASAVSSATMGGAFHDALNEWVQQSNDAAALVRKTFAETATGINDDLARALTDPTRNGYERMQNLRNALSGTLRGVANQGITFGLGKLESTLPGELGKLFGGGKKPTGAKGDPLYVAFDGGAGGGSSAAARAAGAAASVSQSIRGGGADQGLGALLNLAVPQSPTVIAPGSSGGGGTLSGIGDIFSSFLPALGGTHAGTPQAAADFSSGSATDAGTSFLDALASYAPQSKISSTAPGFTDGRGSPYTLADLSMMQPDDSGSLDYGGNSVPQQPGIVSVTKKPTGGIGDMVQSLVSAGLHLIPGFASGGPIAPDMGAFIVGERGPEILNIGAASGRVTPNSQLKSFGGDSHHHEHNYNIDARGAGDPAATEAAVHRAMRSYLPAAVTASVAAVSDQKRRMPSTRR